VIRTRQLVCSLQQVLWCALLVMREYEKSGNVRLQKRCRLKCAWLLQSLEDTLHIVREAMSRPEAAVQQQLNLDNDDCLDNFIEDQGAFDEDLPYLADGSLLPFLSSLELQQHDF